eukprot:Hpha_TRINITY_DN15178_c4_g3::TRINITY_DN15178_c4_g3_i1::g.129676::m.129676/K10798/PARP; poly [ADP-ribose] polymerase
MPSALQGKTVVFTGGLKIKRADATAKATALGANVTGSISGKTDIVVAGPGAGSKLAAAEARGTEIWNEQEFLDCVAAGAGGAKKPAAKSSRKKKEEPEEKPKPAAKKKREADDEEPPAKKARKPAAKKSAAAAEPEPATPTKPAAASPTPMSPMSPGRKFPVDREVPSRLEKRVYGEYSCKLNQTNIGGNNNKFYIIQVLEKAGGGMFWAWNRWGRIGEPGQNKLEPHGNVASAIKSFESKFRDKTRNAWAQRDNFKAVDGKYTLLEMDEEEAGGGAEAAPLGKLSESQIQKGMGVLQEIEAELKGGNAKAKLESLSSRFFTLIPTEFGRRVPEAIRTEDKLREKEELLKFWLRMGFEDESREDEAGLTPIEGVMNLAIPATLAASVSGTGCGMGSVYSSDKRGEELAKKQAGSPNIKMEGKLYAAIMLYTSNAIYGALNKALREENRNSVKKYFNYLRLLMEAMNTLPHKNVTLWRGIPVDLHDQYKVGSTQTWWNVSSCTSDIKVAKNFMSGCGGHCSLLTIKAKSATDISCLSFYQNEKESLLAPGTQLKVESCKRAGKVTEITLVETGRLVG